MGVCLNCGSRTYIDRRQREVCLVCDKGEKEKINVEKEQQSDD